MASSGLEELRAWATQPMGGPVSSLAWPALARPGGGRELGKSRATTRDMAKGCRAVPAVIAPKPVQ